MAQFLGYLGLFNLLLFLPVALCLNFTKIEPSHKLTWSQFGLIVGKGFKTCLHPCGAFSRFASAAKNKHIKRKNKHLQRISEFNRASAKRQQNVSYFFQSYIISLGGPSGAYYTSSTTRRAGGDGVVMEESKEADLTARKASHRISKGMHGKGHSVARKLSFDGRVDTLQTLNNSNEGKSQWIIVEE